MREAVRNLHGCVGNTGDAGVLFVRLTSTRNRVTSWLDAVARKRRPQEWLGPMYELLGEAVLSRFGLQFLYEPQNNGAGTGTAPRRFARDLVARHLRIPAGS